MIELVQSPDGEWRSQPRDVLYRASVTAGGTAGDLSRTPTLNHLSNGCQVPVCVSGVKRSVGCVPVSVGCVSSVGCVGGVEVERSVASGLRRVASASGAKAPKSVLQGTLQKVRRAAVAKAYRSMQRRLAGRSAREVGGVQQVARSVVSRIGCVSRLAVPVAVSVSGVVSSERQVMVHRPVASKSRQVASRGASVALQSGLKAVSVASVASVEPVASVGSSEWRQVGDALRSVVSRVQQVVEASTQVSSKVQDRLH